MTLGLQDQGKHVQRHNVDPKEKARRMRSQC